MVPESVRWQIARGQYDLAKVQLNKVAAWNKVVVTDSTLDSMIATTVREKEKIAENTETTKTSILDLFKHSNLRLWWTTGGPEHAQL